MSTATARMTIGSALAMVTNATTSVASVFGATTKAIGMADAYVADAAEKQRARSKIEMSDFKYKLVQEKAMEDTVRKESIRDFCKGSEERAKDYQESYNRLMAILEEKPAQD